MFWGMLDGVKEYMLQYIAFCYWLQDLMLVDIVDFFQAVFDDVSYMLTCPSTLHNYVTDAWKTSQVLYAFHCMQFKGYSWFVKTL